MTMIDSNSTRRQLEEAIERSRRFLAELGDSARGREPQAVALLQNGAVSIDVARLQLRPLRRARACRVGNGPLYRPRQLDDSETQASVVARLMATMRSFLVASDHRVGVCDSQSRYCQYSKRPSASP